MKIVIGSSRPFHLVHLARELSNFGHDVTFIGYMPKWKMKNYNLGTAKYKCIFWSLFPFSLIALFRILPNLQIKVSFSLMPFVDFFISKNIPKCDVFIGLSGVVEKSFITAKKKYNALTICDRGSAHVETQNILISTNLSNKLPAKYIERELKGYKLADYILVPSLFALQTFLDRGFSKEKVFVNNYGVNLDRFNCHNSNKIEKLKIPKINALFVGGWSFQKGVDIISSALEQDVNLYVTHIGTNGGEKTSISPRFTNIGHVSNSHLIDYYKMYDVLLLPSRQDGFGMVILEALACGLPVIASINTGAPDIKNKIEKKENIILLDSISVEALLKAINEVRSFKFNRDAEILSIGDKEFFTWKSYAERYNNILKKSS